MASSVRNVCTKNDQNLSIFFVTINNLLLGMLFGVFLFTLTHILLALFSPDSAKADIG